MKKLSKKENIILCEYDLKFLIKYADSEKFERLSNYLNNLCQESNIKDKYYNYLSKNKINFENKEKK